MSAERRTLRALFIVGTIIEAVAAVRAIQFEQRNPPGTPRRRPT